MSASPPTVGRAHKLFIVYADTIKRVGGHRETERERTHTFRVRLWLLLNHCVCVLIHPVSWVAFSTTSPLSVSLSAFLCVKSTLYQQWLASFLSYPTTVLWLSVPEIQFPFPCLLIPRFSYSWETHFRVSSNAPFGTHFISFHGYSKHYNNHI